MAQIYAATTQTSTYTYTLQVSAQRRGRERGTCLSVPHLIMQEHPPTFLTIHLRPPTVPYSHASHLTFLFVVLPDVGWDEK